MNRMLIACLGLVAFVAAVYGEMCTPDQWQGKGGSTGGYVSHHRPGIIREYKEISYDAKNQQKAIFLTYVNNKFKDNFIMLVRGGKAYIVDENKKKCWAKALKKPFRKACIPKEAKNTYNFTLGLKDGGLKVSSYEVDVKDLSVTVTVSMAGGAIIPVGENMAGSFCRTHFMQNGGFFDITPGIKNATVFDIPKLCDKANRELLWETEMEEIMEQHVLREHSYLGL